MDATNIYAIWHHEEILDCCFFGYLHICHVLLNLYSKFSGKQMSSSASCLMIVPNISVIEIDYHAQQFSFMVIRIACGYLHTQIDFYVNLCNKCMSTAFVCLSHHEGRLIYWINYCSQIFGIRELHVHGCEMKYQGISQLTLILTLLSQSNSCCGLQPSR